MNIGDRVVFDSTVRERPVIGTVRKIVDDMAKCDDGDPNNDDLHTNGFHVSAWGLLVDLEVVK